MHIHPSRPSIPIMGTVVPSFFPSSAQLWVKKAPSLYHETKSSPSHTPPQARPNQSIRTFSGIPVPIHVSHVPSPPALSLSLYRRLAARSQTSLHKPPSLLRSFPSLTPSLLFLLPQQPSLLLHHLRSISRLRPASVSYLSTFVQHKLLLLLSHHSLTRLCYFALSQGRDTRRLYIALVY